MADVLSEDQYFGWSVDIHEDVVIVGARGESNSLSRAGAAYIFEKRHTNWVQAARLTSDGPWENEELCWSVAVNENMAVVGAPGYGSQRWGNLGLWHTGGYPMEFPRRGGHRH